MRKLCKEDAMSTIKITGKVNSAICYAKVVEEEALVGRFQNSYYVRRSFR